MCQVMGRDVDCFFDTFAYQSAIGRVNPQLSAVDKRLNQNTIFEQDAIFFLSNL